MNDNYTNYYYDNNEETPEWECGHKRNEGCEDCGLCIYCLEDRDNDLYSKNDELYQKNLGKAIELADDSVICQECFNNVFGDYYFYTGVFYA